MNYNSLSELLFPDINNTVDYYEKIYPRRDLVTNAKVTRFAPSPTGFMHLGNLYGALADERIARQSGGVFYLRIEDTDKKREVEGAVEAIIKSLEFYGIKFDEGEINDTTKGAYGPYRQRAREDIYKVYAKKLVSEGRAYPCFCSEQDLSDMRLTQESKKVNYGYYGEYAVHRDFSLEQIEEKLNNGEPYVLRFKSMGDITKKYSVSDPIRGEVIIPQNDQDMVLLKSDGIPTYHFAHVVDDYLMRTTTVIRGEEWLSTLPFHIELFNALGFTPPEYIHTAHLLKSENGGKRKLSKRKDEEAALTYYMEKGYPSEALIIYLLTLLNSDFEDWYRVNTDKSYLEFPVKAEKFSISGALFDLNKLNDISKEFISKQNAENIYNRVTEYAKAYDDKLYMLLSENKKYAVDIFAIGRDVPKPRKDIAYFSQIFDYISFFYDDYFEIKDNYPENITADDRTAILQKFADIYDENDTNEQWFEKMKAICTELGFAANTKDYKAEPDKYNGHVGDVSMVLRIAVTGRSQSPDLCQCMKIIGKKGVIKRLERI